MTVDTPRVNRRPTLDELGIAPGLQPAVRLAVLQELYDHDLEHPCSNPSGWDPVFHFEDSVKASPELEPVATLDELAQSYVAAALRRCGGSVRKAAKMLGVGKSTLYRHVREGRGRG